MLFVLGVFVTLAVESVILLVLHLHGTRILIISGKGRVKKA